MAEEKQDKNLDRRTFLKLIGAASGTIAIAGITSVAFGAGGGAAGIGGGGAAEGSYSNGWCSFWHDEQDPTYGSSSLNGPNPQGWDEDSARNQLDRLNRMVALDYYGDTNHSLSAITRDQSGYGVGNQLYEVYFEQAAIALQLARDRATAQRGQTVNHARVIGVGIRYMITDWAPDTYGRDGSATATFGTPSAYDPPLFYRNEMNPADMKASSRGIASGLQEQGGWSQPSDIYGYTIAQGFATNRDGEWQRAADDLNSRYTLIVIAIAEGEPMAAGKLTVKKVLQGVDTNHEFTFHLVATSGNQTTKDETFKLKHNQETTITIPANSNYTVEEQESYGFKLLSFTNNQGTIKSGDEITATATNVQLGYATMEKKLTM